MSNKDFELWLAAAYRYYWAVDDAHLLMGDWEWDGFARQFERNPPNHPMAKRWFPDNKYNSAFHIPEDEYPEELKSV